MEGSENFKWDFKERWRAVKGSRNSNVSFEGPKSSIKGDHTLHTFTVMYDTQVKFFRRVAKGGRKKIAKEGSYL